MSLFDQGKKKEPACCSNGDSSGKCGDKSADTSKNPDARFIVLGACCQKSTDTFKNVKQAVKELGFCR